MTTQAWRRYDPVDGNVDWRSVRDDGAVIAGLVKLGRSTVVYTYDPRLVSLDGARFASAEAARAAIDAALTAPVPHTVFVPTQVPARPKRGARRVAAVRDDRFYDG
jgi:hypothetical protein